VTAKPEAIKQPVETKAIEAKTVETKAEEMKPVAAALRIPTPEKHTEAAAEAPNLTLVASAGMPDLLAPKAASAKLAVKKTTATPPVLQHSVAPVYPDIARRSGTSGDVHMQLTISPEGRVANVRVIDVAPILRQAATSAVSQWTYRAATMDGRPIDSTVDVVVKFAQR
jgi:protein TonB